MQSSSLFIHTVPSPSTSFLSLCISCWDIQAFCYDVTRLFGHNLRWMHYLKKNSYLLMYSIHCPYCSLHNYQRYISTACPYHNHHHHISCVSLLGHNNNNCYGWLLMMWHVRFFPLLRPVMKEFTVVLLVMWTHFTIQALFCHCVCVCVRVRVCLCVGLGVYVCYQPEDDY